LQTGKEQVLISQVEPVGHYAVRLVFDDGHDSGLFTWKYLYELGRDQDDNWQAYLDRLAAGGYSRYGTPSPMRFKIMTQPVGPFTAPPGLAELQRLTARPGL
jgi:hypothetical protein